MNGNTPMRPMMMDRMVAPCAVSNLSLTLPASVSGDDPGATAHRAHARAAQCIVSNGIDRPSFGLGVCLGSG